MKKTPSKSNAQIAPAPKSDVDRWQAEDDLRTLQRFQELKANPSRMRQVEAHLKKQMAAVNQVRGRK